MSQLPNTSSATSAAAAATAANKSNSAGTASNRFNEVGVEDFLKLMFAELQNQDPLNPTDNNQLMAQIGQIREITATDKLTSTLDSVLLGQNVASATNLIGAEVDGLSDDRQNITGVVSSVTVSGGEPKLHLDLNPTGKATADEGALEAGTYQYLVTWQEKGKTFAVDPLERLDKQAITTTGKAGVDKAILLSNLPKTTATKQIYRKEGTGTEPYKLVASITDVKQATFLDTTAESKLSGKVLSSGFQLIKGTNRTFDVSLKNVGQIRPPKTPTPATSTSTTTTPTNNNGSSSNSDNSNTSSGSSNTSGSSTTTTTGSSGSTDTSGATTNASSTSGDDAGDSTSGASDTAANP